MNNASFHLVGAFNLSVCFLHYFVPVHGEIMSAHTSDTREEGRRRHVDHLYFEQPKAALSAIQ